MHTPWLIKLKPYRYYLGMAAVILLALFMRFHRLGSLPPGLHPDEAANGLDIFTIIEHHNFQPFYPRNGGREGLFFIIQALFVWLYGNTILALRIAPALIGTAAVGVTYLWGRAWFNQRTGFLAAFLMSVTPWAVIISRDGYRAGMVALMVPLILWLYTKALRNNRTWWYVAAGVSLGTGFYTYIAFRLFPLVLLIAGGSALYWRRSWWRSVRRGVLVSCVAGAITLIPMGIYGIQHPAELVSRAGGVSFLNPSLNDGHPATTLVATIVKTAGMFNFHGDNNYRQNLGGAPELNIFVGAMFILGILVCVRRRHQWVYPLVPVVFGVMLLPEILTAEGIPHALRSIGALPAVMMLAALGITYLLDTWRGVFPLNALARGIGTGAVAVLLMLTVYQGYVEYFVAWANAPQTYDAYAEDTATLGLYFNAHPFSGERFAIGGQYTLMPVAYLTHHHSTYIPLDPTKVSTLNPPTGVAKQFSILEGDKPTVLPELRQKYPTGQLSPHYSAFSGKELFVLYTVPAS